VRRSRAHDNANLTTPFLDFCLTSRTQHSFHITVNLRGKKRKKRKRKKKENTNIESTVVNIVAAIVAIRSPAKSLCVAEGARQCFTKARKEITFIFIETNYHDRDRDSRVDR